MGSGDDDAEEEAQSEEEEDAAVEADEPEAAAEAAPSTCLKPRWHLRIIQMENTCKCKLLVKKT